MKVEILDRDVFGAIRPEALLRYLIVNGWIETRRIENELIVFGKTNSVGKNFLVWMPITDQFSDYASMVARLVKTIAEVEDKSELQILDDLQTVALGDIVRVRTFDPLDAHDHTLLFVDGRTLLSRIRLMAVAAASSVLNKRPVHPRRPASEVNKFIRSLRLGQTERGSFLLRLIVPIEEQIEQYALIHGMPKVTPFSRRAVIELIRSLRALKEAAEDNRDRGRFVFNSFVSVVNSGVSANLCESLISSEEDETTVKPMEVSVTWSYALPSDNISGSPILFDSSVIPYIRQAAKEFRAKNPEVTTIKGWVNILERDTQHLGPGSIRVLASIDGKPRSVRMILESQAYDIAIDAHKKGETVTVTGTLVFENGIYRLDKPTNFATIDQPSLFDVGSDLPE